MSESKDYKNIKDLTADILIEYINLKEKGKVICIGDYKITESLLRNIIYLSTRTFFELIDLDLCNYVEDEFLLTIENKEISIIPMQDEDGCITYDGDVLFIDGNCNSSILKKCENRDIKIIDYEIENK